MDTFSNISSNLIKINSRNEIIKNHFNQFKGCVNHLSTDASSLKGISVNEISDTEIGMSFIGCDYKFVFSPTVDNIEVKGEIEFHRVLSDKESKLLDTITFNASGVFDYPVDEGEDQVFMDEGVSVMTMILNILYESLP